MSDANAHQPFHRWLAIALFVGLPALLTTLSAMGLTRHAELRFAASQAEAQLQQLRQRAVEAEDAGTSTVDFSAIYLAATAASLADAELQQFLSTRVVEADGSVIETVILNRTDDDGAPGTTRARVTFDIDNDGLIRLLYDLETGLPFIAVESLAVRPLGSQSDGDGENAALRVDLAIRGYWRPPTG